MKVKNLLVKSNFGESYLIIGYTYGITSQPEEWQLPVIPNEYGKANLEKVIKQLLKDNYGISLSKIIDWSDDSDLVFVEAVENEVKEPAIIYDPEGVPGLLELRGFVSKEVLKSLIKSQGSILGKLIL